MYKIPRACPNSDGYPLDPGACGIVLVGKTADKTICVGHFVFTIACVRGGRIAPSAPGGHR